MSALVKINGVHKYFTRGSERIDVLKGVTLDIPQGDFLALMGPSGSGKTTLLNLMGGLDQPSGGTIEVGGTNIGGAVRRPAVALALASHRLRVSALQPAAGADRGTQRRSAAAAHEAVEGRAAQARGDRAEGGGPRRSRQALSAPAVRRPGAARRHRARDRHRPDAAALRRADRRSRSQGRRRDPRSAAGAQPRSRQDHRDGHARSARRRARQADAAPREGPADGRGCTHEVPAAALEQPVAEEDPHHLHAAVGLRRVPAVRPADDDPHRVHASASTSPASIGSC